VLQVEIVRFRTDTTSVGQVIVERAATLDAAAVVRCQPSQSVLFSNTFYLNAACSGAGSGVRSLHLSALCMLHPH
jgi:hypothetical protein